MKFSDIISRSDRYLIARYRAKFGYDTNVLVHRLDLILGR